MTSPLKASTSFPLIIGNYATGRGSVKLLCIQLQVRIRVELYYESEGNLFSTWLFWLLHLRVLDNLCPHSVSFYAHRTVICCLVRIWSFKIYFKSSIYRIRKTEVKTLTPDLTVSGFLFSIWHFNFVLYYLLATWLFCYRKHTHTFK